MNKLCETIRYPSFLIKAGFIEREEDTSSLVRWVWFEKTKISSDVTLILQVEYEFSRSESMEPELYNPFAKTYDNETYDFNGVYLKIVEGGWNSEHPSREEVLFAKVPYLPVIMGEPRDDRISLSVNTRAQLRSLCKMLGCKD